jgi:uncharacterized integral membrane protein (TIGR00697 family)
MQAIPQVNSRGPSKYLMILVMLFITFDFTSTLLVFKIVSFGKLLLPASCFIYPLNYVLADIIAEVYGFSIARTLVWTDLFCQYLFAGLMVLMIQLPSPGFWHHQNEYNYVFGSLFKIFGGSTVAMLVGNFSNIYLLRKWGYVLKGRLFLPRSIFATVVGEFLYLAIGVPIVFYGTLHASQMVNLMLTNLGVKIIFTVICAIPALFIADWLKKKDYLFSYKSLESFNPFKV